MTLISEIQHWFQRGKVFGMGYTLLARTAFMPKTLAILQSYVGLSVVPNSAKGTLEYALLEYLKANKEHLTDNDTIEQELQEKPSNVDELADAKRIAQERLNEPTAIAVLRARSKIWWDRYALAKGMMQIATTDQQRYELAKEIMEEITPALDDIYDSIRSYEQDGTVPGGAKVSHVVKETIVKYKRVINLRTKVSRLRKKLEGKLSAGGKAEGEKKLLDYELELRGIENELDLN